uniref:Uncharacterized protein n=1 Tax=viral metagenome TaxID=1070528 RepID=A0A6C0BTP0_9ZZZZ
MAKATRKNYRGGDGASWVSSKVGGLAEQTAKALSPTSKTNTLTGGSRRRKSMKKMKTKSKRGGASRKNKRTRRRKGGFLGSVISSAIVPFGLWGAQRRLARRMKKRS